MKNVMNLVIDFSTFDEFEGKINLLKNYLSQHANEKKSLIFYALLEAINNAFEHGLSDIEDKQLKVECEMQEKQLIVEFSHNGHAFDYEEKLEIIGNPETFLEANITESRGRGIPIMLRCTDRLTYSQEGRSVQLIFLLS